MADSAPPQTGPAPRLRRRAASALPAQRPGPRGREHMRSLVHTDGTRWPDRPAGGAARALTVPSKLPPQS